MYVGEEAGLAGYAYLGRARGGTVCLKKMKKANENADGERELDCGGDRRGREERRD